MSGLFIRNLRTNTSLLFKPSSSIIIRNSSFKSIQNDMKLLLNNNNNSKNRLVSLASSLSSSQPRVQKRFLSSEKSELDKAQWERSDRYRVYYGLDDDEATDKAKVHLYSFLGIFWILLLPSFLIYYYPDYRQEEWCYREAHLELARREKAGLPPVSPDYVPVENIKLPTDEELGDTEIII